MAYVVALARWRRSSRSWSTPATGRPPLNVLIVNAYSARNRGDGMIVSQMVRLFASAGAGQVMSDDPARRGSLRGRAGRAARPDLALRARWAVEAGDPGRAGGDLVRPPAAGVSLGRRVRLGRRRLSLRRRQPHRAPERAAPPAAAARGARVGRAGRAVQPVGRAVSLGPVARDRRARAAPQPARDRARGAVAAVVRAMGLTPSSATTSPSRSSRPSRPGPSRGPEGRSA